MIFLFLLRMTAGTVHIDETFSEMEIGNGIDMAVHAYHFTLMVDILRPLLRVHEEGTHGPLARNLENIRFSMTEKAILVSIFLRKRTVEKDTQKDERNEYSLL